MPSSVKVCNAIIDICHELKEWKTLAEHITLLCKRRAQLKKVNLFFFPFPFSQHIKDLTIRSMLAIASASR